MFVLNASIIFSTGQVIKNVEKGSITLTIGFEDSFGVAALLRDYKNGDFEIHFRPIQEAIRLVAGYQDYTLHANITTEAFLFLFKTIGIFLMDCVNVKQ